MMTGPRTCLDNRLYSSENMLISLLELHCRATAIFIGQLPPDHGRTRGRKKRGYMQPWPIPNSYDSLAPEPRNSFPTRSPCLPTSTIVDASKTSISSLRS